MLPAAEPSRGLPTYPRARPANRSALTRSDGSPIRILVVDDDRIVAEMVSMTLRWEGADVLTVADTSAATGAVRRHRPDVVLLDSRLSKDVGAVVLDALHELHSSAIALLLLAEEHHHARKTRLVAGDHCLPKPFSFEELLVRILTLLRHNGIDTLHDAVEMTLGGLVISEDSREVVRDGTPIHLSHTEFELLRFFMRNAYHVVTKPQILGHVWPYDYTGRTSVVELYVSYLRRKIDLGRTPMIHTLRRTGYILKAG